MGGEYAAAAAPSSVSINVWMNSHSFFVTLDTLNLDIFSVCLENLDVSVLVAGKRCLDIYSHVLKHASWLCKLLELLQ